ncbi:transaldolase family protein [Dongshaea marina]|uniref:transaldolase family protein n=1 Tax=Dongshaea marina TaxID=2047966 RepID=UPI000D3E38A1|nr:transaldolase family protein [Dongshaea marina]
MEFYLDSADLNVIEHFNRLIPLAGVTTNPTIVAKQELRLNQLLPRLRELLGPEAIIHAQLVSQEESSMIKEGMALAQCDPNLVIKVPVTETGLRVIRALKSRQQRVLGTAVYSASQGLMAALAGADYVAPYVNRIDTLPGDGVATVASLQDVLEAQQLPCKILAASFKSSAQAMKVIEAGVAAITLPADVAYQMLNHPAVPGALEQFAEDWQHRFGQSLSYT